MKLLNGQSAEAVATFRKIDSEAGRLEGIALAEYALRHEKSPSRLSI